MVFIHGGRFVTEGASTDFYWGRYLANQTNTVVVTLSYRLGVLGWLVSDLFPGNLGLQDQRAALHWVQSNIHSFGGDRTKVTLFGESVGAASVLLHMVSPASQGQGLFSRVILESATVGIRFWGFSTLYKFSSSFASHIGCHLNDLACLQNKTSDDVLKAQIATKQDPWPDTFERAFQWSPCIGTNELPYQPLHALTSGQFEKVPILLGSNRDEGFAFVYAISPDPISTLTYEADIMGIFGILHGAKIISYYPVPKNESKDARPVMSMVATHKVFACASRYLAASLTTQMKFPVYMYYWDHAFSFNPWGAQTWCINKSCHGEELPFVFNTPSMFNFSFSKEEAVLQNQVATLWGRFAHGVEGPIPISNLSWPPYSTSTNISLRFDIPLSLEKNRLAEDCDMWDTLGYELGDLELAHWGVAHR